MYVEKELTEKIIGACIEVHRHLGPGLLESVYQKCVAYELRQRGLRVQTEVELPIRYKELDFESAYKADLIVEDAVIIELKAVDQMNPVFEAQLLTYMRLSGIRVGLLINFNVKVLKDGITRRVL